MYSNASFRPNTYYFKYLLRFWWRNGQVFIRYFFPFIPFVDQHNRNIFDNRVFTTAVLANKPGVFV